MVEDLEGGGSSSSSGYESFDGPEVKVNINGLIGYFMEMGKISSAAAGPSTMEVSAMTTMVREGLATAPPDVGVFPEGLTVANMLYNRQAQFQMFLGDVIEGIRNVGSAAAVVAEIYENSDSENAASINDIGFAFSDYRATPPAGFRPVESWSEYERRVAEENGTNAMSLTGDDSRATVIRPAGGVVIYYYPDGSSKQIVTTTRPGVSGHQSETTVTLTTFFGPNGQKIQTISNEESTVYGGSRVQSTTTGTGDDQNGTSSTTTTIQNPDGSISVDNSTTTTADGESTTEESERVTVTPDTHRDNDDEAMGPVETAEERYDEYGDDEYVEAFGRGY